MRYLYAALISLLIPFVGAAQDESMIPTGTAESTNNSCTTGNAHTTCDDDPDSPGGDWCTASTCAANPTNPTAWRFTFNTPASNPSFGAGAQSFDAYVKLCQSGGSSPTCQLDLYCNGSLVTAGSAQSVTSGTGQKLTQTHQLTGACASDGSDVELRVNCTASGGSPGGRRTADLDAVEWDVTYASGARHVIVVSQAEKN